MAPPIEIKKLENKLEPGSSPKGEVKIADKFLAYDSNGNNIGWVRAEDVFPVPPIYDVIYDAHGKSAGWVQRDCLNKGLTLEQDDGRSKGTPPDPPL